QQKHTREYEMQTYMSESNRRAFAQQKRRKYKRLKNIVSQDDSFQQEIEHEQSQLYKHKLQTHIPVPNRRAIAQQERRRHEILENIVNQGSTFYQEIKTGQSKHKNQILIPKPIEDQLLNKKEDNVKELEQRQVENSVNQKSVFQQKRQQCKQVLNN
ncbi:17447_t:CDS:2, partial [Gigaspora margarita]